MLGKCGGDGKFDSCGWCGNYILRQNNILAIIAGTFNLCIWSKFLPMCILGSVKSPKFNQLDKIQARVNISNISVKAHGICRSCRGCDGVLWSGVEVIISSCSPMFELTLCINKTQLDLCSPTWYSQNCVESEKLLWRMQWELQNRWLWAVCSTSPVPITLSVLLKLHSKVNAKSVGNL